MTSSNFKNRQLWGVATAKPWSGWKNQWSLPPPKLGISSGWWGLEPHISAHAPGIRVFRPPTGDFLLIPIQNSVANKQNWGQLTRQVRCWQGVIDQGASEFWGFGKIWGCYDVISGGRMWKFSIFRPEVAFRVDARWLLNRIGNGKRFSRDQTSSSSLTQFGAR